ncbi:hypothetical protein GCM10027614_12860 [Micromonospora vulcania]
MRRRRHIGRLRSVDESIRQIDYAVRNVRVLARAGVSLNRLHTTVPPELGAALRSLAEAVREAGAALAADLDGQDETAERHAARAETAALAAVHTAGQLFSSTQTLPLAMIIGQVRATAIDLLRGVNPDDDAVLTRVDEALGVLPHPDHPDPPRSWTCGARQKRRSRPDRPAQRHDRQGCQGGVVSQRAALSRIGVGSSWVPGNSS